MIRLNCYYLFPTLPTLKVFDARGMTSHKFLNRCTRELSKDEVKILKHVSLNNFSDFPSNPSFKKWQQFELKLRNQLIALRAQKLGLNPIQFLRSSRKGKRVQISPAVQSIFDELSPIKAEKMLFELRWQCLNRMDSEYYFSLDNLIVYYLKLQLLEQWNRFDQENGKKILDRRLASSQKELNQRLNNG